MTRPAGVPCTVIRSPEFTAQAEAIEPDYERLDAMLFGGEWVIARSPLRGQVDVVLNPGGGLPRVLVTVDISDEEAILREIAAYPE